MDFQKPSAPRLSCRLAARSCWPPRSRSIASPSEGIRIVVDGGGRGRAESNPLLRHVPALVKTTRVTQAEATQDAQAGAGRMKRRRGPTSSDDVRRRRAGPPTPLRKSRAAIWRALRWSLQSGVAQAQELALSPRSQRGPSGRGTALLAQLGALDAHGRHHRATGDSWPSAAAIPRPSHNGSARRAHRLATLRPPILQRA